MSREHHHKDAGGGAGAGSSADDGGAAGKRARSEDAPRADDDDGPVASASRASPAHLRETVRKKYLPSVKRYKELAVEEMRESFSQNEQVGSSFLAIAIKGVAAGAGAALAASAGGGLLVTALSTGAAEVASGIAGSFGSKGSLKANEFCSRYAARLQRNWFRISDNVLGKMTDDSSAHEIHGHMKKLYNDDGLVRREMREELLDAWTNALRYERMENKPGMGSKSFNDPTEGRLHLGTFELNIEHKQSAPRVTSSTAATMEGVPGPDARNVNQHRRLDDMRIARTIRVHWDGYGVNGNVNLGIAPGSTTEISELGADDSIDRFAMASYYVGKRLDRDDAGPLEGGHDQKKIDANWRPGMHHIWSLLRGKTVAQLRLGSVKA